MADAQDNMDFELSDEEIQRLDPIVRDFACLNGILFLEENGNINHIPLTLLPTPFRRRAYNKMVRLQTEVNLLYHRASCDHEFLKEALKDIIKLDDYMKNLWQIYVSVREDMVQKTFLGLVRTDYMLHPNKDIQELQPKQVEVNLMASGLGSLSEKLVETHRLALNMSGLRSEDDVKQMVPANGASTGLAQGILSAHQHYGEPSAAILFIVGEHERNRFDQRALEESICRASPSIVVLRRTFFQLHRPNDMELRGDSRCLFVGGHEIAVIYFRHGYSPSHFPEPWVWSVRLALEQSRAIKSPSVQHMLVNTKRVQQVLSDRATLQRFVDDPEIVEALLSTFAGQYDPRNPAAFAAAIARPNQFVLKPQREGGGNNFFGNYLRERLESLEGRKELGAYVLMERLCPPSSYNVALVPNCKPTRYAMVSELGIFGVILGDAKNVIENYSCGHLMRSKSEDIDEGGVHRGYACLDSPLLI